MHSRILKNGLKNHKLQFHYQNNHLQEQKTLINNDANKQKSKPRVPAPKKEKTKDQHTN